MSLENPQKINESEQAINADKNTTERMTYNLESGATIDISCRVFNAKHKDIGDMSESNSERTPGVATIFLPGWAMGADTESARKLSEAFADSSEN